MSDKERVIDVIEKETTRTIFLTIKLGIVFIFIWGVVQLLR